MKTDAILLTLKKHHRMRHVPDLHSFKAKIENGVVFVDCGGPGVDIHIFIYDAKGQETRELWQGYLEDAAEKLKALKIDLSTLET